MPDKVFLGRIDRIAADRSTLRITMDNMNRLLVVGMAGELSIERAGLPGLAIPRTAIVGGAVLVPQGTAPDGRARFVEKAVAVVDPDSSKWATVNGLTPTLEIVADASAVH